MALSQNYLHCTIPIGGYIYNQAFTTQHEKIFPVNNIDSKLYNDIAAGTSFTFRIKAYSLTLTDFDILTKSESNTLGIKICKHLPGTITPLNEILNCNQLHEEYYLTADTERMPGKKYYKLNGSRYSAYG